MVKGNQPMSKKVDAMMRLKEQKTLKNYDHLHVLEPLVTSLTSVNIPRKWGEEQSKAYKETNIILSKNVLLSLPVFN